MVIKWDLRYNIEFLFVANCNGDPAVRAPTIMALEAAFAKNTPPGSAAAFPLRPTMPLVPPPSCVRKI